MDLRIRSLRRFMARQSGWLFVLIAGMAAFSAYACVYALRKPFTAATFSGQELWGIQYKIALVIAQVAGYALSKFIGIQVIPGLRRRQRLPYTLLLALVAWVALLGLALSGPGWGVFWMFINGIPLGMAWGIIFGYLEGRKFTEALTALLCANFVVSSGFVKTVGMWMMLHHQISERWMPFAVGALFFPLLLLSIWLLDHLPKPTQEDKNARHERSPMTTEDKQILLREYGWGVFVLVVIYLLLTIVRDLRDNFSVEIWAELKFAGQPSILTLSELPIAFAVLTAVALLSWIKSNRRALMTYIGLILGSAVLLLAITQAFLAGWLSPVSWMISSGVFIILPYILFNGILFDRMMGAFRLRGNVGFLMYIADAFGYLGSVAVLVYRNFGQHELSWVSFFTSLCQVSAVLMVAGAVFVGVYFRGK